MTQTNCVLALPDQQLGVSSAPGRACAPTAPPGTQILQAAPPTRIPPRPPSGVAEPELSLRLPRLRDDEADLAPQVPSRSRAARAGARTTGGTQEFGARGLAPPPGHRDRARRAGAPSPGRRRPPGSRARAPCPGAQPAAPAGLPPSPQTRPRSSAPPPPPGSAAPGPRPPFPAWASSDSRKSDLPARCPTPRAEAATRRRRKTQRRGHRLGWGSRLPEALLKSRPATATRPARGTVSGRGAVAGLGGRPGEPGSWSYLRESSQHQASDSRQLSVPSCGRHACPTALSPLAWAAGRALRVRPAPRPRLPPRPPETPPPSTQRWWGRWQSRGSGACSSTWSACRPRPGPNQASCGGVPRVRGGRKPRAPRFRG
nr:proline-rich protein 36-like [Globicephala melas]